MLVAKILGWWLLLAFVAIINGIVRAGTYGRQLSDLAAHQVSTLTAVLATGLVVWFLNRSWPFGSAGEAWVTGLWWLALTILFEFGFGHFVAGHSWQKLLADYNIFAGRLWLLFLAWIAFMPWLIHRIAMLD